MKDYVYEVFGVIVSLPHERRMLRPAAIGSVPQICVAYGQVALQPGEAVAERHYEEMAARVSVSMDGTVLWTTPNARFSIKGGNQVTIDAAEPGVRPGPMLHFVISYCLPAALIQRGSVVLHANAVVTPRGAVVVGGNSGAGKSTTAAALMARGHQLLSDDVTVISAGVDGRLWVASGFPAYRVCQDTLQRIAMPAAGIHPLGGERGKFSIVAPEHAFHGTAAPLRAIYLMELHERTAIDVVALRSLEKLSALRSASYAPVGIADSQTALGALASVARAAGVYRIRRPRDRWTVDELADLVEEESLRNAGAAAL